MFIHKIQIYSQCLASRATSSYHPAALGTRDHRTLFPFSGQPQLASVCSNFILGGQYLACNKTYLQFLSRHLSLHSIGNLRTRQILFPLMTLQGKFHFNGNHQSPGQWLFHLELPSTTQIPAQ